MANNQKYTVYVLRSQKDGNLYTGHTQNLKKRLEEHNSGKVKSTALRRPFVILHSEECATRAEARWRERKHKTAWGKTKLKDVLGLK